MTIHYKETKYGFEFGNATIQRLMSDDKKGWVTIGIGSSKYPPGKEVQIYVTKTGKIRIFSDGEWFKGDKK